MSPSSLVATEALANANASTPLTQTQTTTDLSILIGDPGLKP